MAGGREGVRSVDRPHQRLKGHLNDGPSGCDRSADFNRSCFSRRKPRFQPLLRLFRFTSLRCHSPSSLRKRGKGGGRKFSCAEIVARNRLLGSCCTEIYLEWRNQSPAKSPNTTCGRQVDVQRCLTFSQSLPYRFVGILDHFAQVLSRAQSEHHSRQPGQVTTKVFAQRHYIASENRSAKSRSSEEQGGLFRDHRAFGSVDRSEIRGRLRNDCPINGLYIRNCPRLQNHCRKLSRRVNPTDGVSQYLMHAGAYEVLPASSDLQYGAKTV